MDEPYTRPDEDPFCTPSRHLACRPRADSASSYDLVDDDDIPGPSPRSFRALFSPRHARSPSTPTPSKRRSFLPAALSSDTLPLPRPSFSSSSSSLRPYSYRPAMSTTTFDTDSGTSHSDTPTKAKHSFFHSLRSRNKSPTPSPYPTHSLSNITDTEDSNIDNYDFLPPPSNRFSHASSASASSSHLSSRPKKKRKLLVSGIGACEFRKLEGIKRWCETFGELRSITRLPNGDLQIDFRDPTVADSVCRIRAKVFIAGVGSVLLSWTTGNKR